MQQHGMIGLVLLCASAAAQGLGERAQPVRDPDRGLERALRDRLALLDATHDAWDVERWTVRIDAHLQELSQRWSERRFDGEPPAWLATDLAVAPWFGAQREDAPARGEWLSTSAAAASAAPRPLWALLAEWRARFDGDSRLDCEVYGVHGTPPDVAATVRLAASGASGGASSQWNVVWTCTWRLANDDATLVEVKTESCARATLGEPAPPFIDVTESLFDDPAYYRERLAPGLDHWRRVLAAPLGPGALGHHGVALGDVDGDGLEDLYVCRPGGLPNLLLRHLPDGGVADVASAAGVDLCDYSSSALFVELDGDGDLDLVVATSMGLVFFANDGAAHFEKKLVIERSLATSMCAADADGDGDVDVYVCSYLSPYEKNGLPVPYHDANNGEANVLLRNEGAFRFVDATAELGLDVNNRRFSFAAAWADFDADGDLDLYVANDFGRNNLYRKDGERYHDAAGELGAEDISAGMGVDWGDFDGDGWLDLYVTNMCTRAGSRLTSREDARDAATLQAYRDHAQGNTLLSNRGGRGFRDVAEASGTSFGRWGWGSIFVDFDLDGALDLFAPNGFVTGEREPDLDSFFWREVVLQSPDSPGDSSASYALGWRAVNRLMRQGFSWNGHERNVALWNVGGRFVDASDALGLAQEDDSRAAARVDWDGDGDEDLVLTNRNAPMLRVLENRQSTGHAWIAFELAGSDPRRTAIGASVTVETDDGRKLVRPWLVGSGYLAQSSARLSVGLGRASVKRVEVRWPNGEREDFGAPSPNAAYRLTKGAGAPLALPKPAARRATKPSSPPQLENLGARTVLPTPLALPRLALATWDGKPASLFGITVQGPVGTGAPLVLFLWSADDERSTRELERLAAAAERLRQGGIAQVLALSVDAEASARERAVAKWQALAWPFARGFVGEESLQVLELVLGALHDDASGLRVPAALLVDASGRVLATYEARIEPETLVRDLALAPLEAEARRAACLPFAGRWLTPPPGPFAADVGARLDAHGLARPASEYSLARVEVRRSSSADIDYEVGLARQRQGRLAEAIELFQRVLAADPKHSAAARALAVALHQKGDLEPALAAYGRALELEPRHAQTHCNLGLLHLARGDRAAAEKELATLRELHSDLAEKLDAALRAAGGR